MKSKYDTGNAKKGLRRRNIRKGHIPGITRVTRHPNGRLKKTFVPLQLNTASTSTTSSTPAPLAQLHTDSAQAEHPGLPSGLPSGEPNITPAVRLPASYYDRKAKEVGYWASVRTQMLEAASVTVNPSADACCETCGETITAPIRCLNCGPKVLWCRTCAVDAHHVRPYHSMEQWSVSRDAAHDHD
jgi:hypothetical protein